MRKKVPQFIFFISILGSNIFFGCENIEKPTQEKLHLPFQEYSMTGDSIQTELDEIYILLAYSIVFQDWQPDSIPRFDRRGYNIGTVLVNSENEVVHWALNCINSSENTTQHGEVRAITSYLDSLKSFDLKGFTLYTTLEPCVMCAGMMTMTSVKRVVYGQKDVDYSNALERLAVNTEEFGGYAPYPRTVISDAAPTQYKIALDKAFANFLQTDDEKFLAKFLTTHEAYQIYKQASEQFSNYQVKYEANKEKYLKAKEFFEKIYM